MPDFILVPANLPAELRAWLALGQDLLERMGSPITVANIVNAPSDQSQRPRPRESSTRAATMYQREGLRTNAEGKYVVQRGVQSYADVAAAVLGSEPFTTAEAWELLKPHLARVTERGDEYLARSLSRDPRFVTNDDGTTWRKIMPTAE